VLQLLVHATSPDAHGPGPDNEPPPEVELPAWCADWELQLADAATIKSSAEPSVVIVECRINKGTAGLGCRVY
jgi:hypothetical protein